MTGVLKRVKSQVLLHSRLVKNPTPFEKQDIRNGT